MQHPQSSSTASRGGASPSAPPRAWRQALEPALRRLFHLYWRFQRGLTLGVRALVIDGEGRIFLVEHSYVSGWHLPGGGVEVGETLLDALGRELREEANIELVGRPDLHAVYFHPLVSPRDHVALFVVRSFRQIGPPVPNREIVAHGFFPSEALPEGTTAGSRARIAEVLHGAPVAERW
jgi:ADP-ribose pyrophosphatase YjhB (NUDIX family)